MKITVKLLAGAPPAESYTLSAFADKHGLSMEVVERGRHFPADGRFYAHWEHVNEVDEYPVCVGAHGNGASPAGAIADYAVRIAGHKIKHDAWSRDQIVRCPDRFEPEHYAALPIDWSTNEA
jgi:hypothetical protein